MLSFDPFTLSREELIKRVKEASPPDKLKLLRHPWIFLSTCVYTTDEKSKGAESTVKAFPVEKEYLREMTRQWIEEDLIVVCKSRQLMATWIFTALCLHRAITKTNQQIFFVSTDREAADEVLMKRAAGIYERIPEDIWPSVLRPSMNKKQYFISFKEIGSDIRALAKGKEQFRGYVGSVVFDDEGGFWDDAEETIATQRPAVGKMVVVSTVPETYTAEPPYFWHLVYDGGRIKAHDKKTIRKGYKTWHNPENGFCAIELHYSADSEKDNPVWVANSKRGMPKKQWDREVDMKWTKSAGTPVYGSEFSAEFHICPDYQPDPSFEIIRGWDFGFNQCAVFGQYIGGRLYIFDEVTAEAHFPGESHVGTKRFAPFIKEYSAHKYPNFTFIDVVDPAGNARDQGSEDRIIQPMRDAGLRPILGEKLFEKRRETVLELLGRVKGGLPSLMVDPNNCPMIMAGMMGGYQYPESKGKAITARPDRPLKNKYSHCVVGETLVNTPNGPTQIKDVKVGDLVSTHLGFLPVASTMHSEVEKTLLLEFSDGTQLECTLDHPIVTDKGILSADDIQYGTGVLHYALWEEKQSTQFKNATESSFTESLKVTTSQITENMGPSTCTDMFGLSTTGQYLAAALSTILMKTNQITASKTFNYSQPMSMQASTVLTDSLTIRGPSCEVSTSLRELQRLGIQVKKGENGTLNIQSKSWQIGPLSYMSVLNAPKNIVLNVDVENEAIVRQIAKAVSEGNQELITRDEIASSVASSLPLTSTQKRNAVPTLVRRSYVNKPKKVYDLTIPKAHTFFANSILTLQTQDCVQYLACYALVLAREQRGYDYFGTTIPDMSYSFVDDMD